VTRYPRTLVISAAPLNERSATGVTLGNLFRGWPQDRLAQVYCSSGQPDSNICCNFWGLQRNDVPADRLLRGIVGRLARFRSDGLSRPTRTAPGIGSRKTMRARLSAWADLAPIKGPTGFWSWVRRFGPDVIVSNLGSIRQIRLTSSVAEELTVPVVPFFHDDWPSTMYNGDAMVVFPRRALTWELDRCLRLAPVGIANSEEMAREFTDRFGRQFHAFMDCVEVGEYWSPVAGDHEVSFTYVGGLHLDRWRALGELAQAITVARERGSKARLAVYSPDADIALLPERVLKSNCVTIGGSVSGDAMVNVLRQAGVLVHVESFDPAIRDYTRLSFSTKLPLYMSAGRAILAYGPPEGASVRYVGDNGLGVVVREKATEQLLSAVVRLSADAELRDGFGQAAWLLAKEKYTGDRMRDRFQTLLQGVAELPWRGGQRATRRLCGIKVAI